MTITGNLPHQLKTLSANFRQFISPNWICWADKFGFKFWFVGAIHLSLPQMSQPPGSMHQWPDRVEFWTGLMGTAVSSLSASHKATQLIKWETWSAIKEIQKFVKKKIKSWRSLDRPNKTQVIVTWTNPQALLHQALWLSKKHWVSRGLPHSRKYSIGLQRLSVVEPPQITIYGSWNTAAFCRRNKGLLCRTQRHTEDVVFWLNARQTVSHSCIVGGKLLVKGTNWSTFALVSWGEGI